MRLQMEQIENILALRARLSNGALVEIPRENPLIMMPAHDGDVLIVMLAETSGNLRTLNNMDRKYKVPPVYKVSPVHNAVVVVEGNYIHWCMVTVDEIAGFVKGNEGRVVQNDNLFLRRGADDEQALRLALPYRAADNNLTVAEVGCDLFIDPTSGALLSSDRRGAAGRLVSARLLFVTHLQRDSAMWTGEQVDAVSKRDTVRTDVSNEDSLLRILATQQIAPPAPVKTRGAPTRMIEMPIPSKYAVATLQMDEDVFNGISGMEIKPDKTHWIRTKDDEMVEVSPLIWHAIDAVRKGVEASLESDVAEVNATFSAPEFADVTIKEADLVFEGLEVGFLGFDANQFILAAQDVSPMNVSGFDFHVMVALAKMNSYGTVFIRQDVIDDRRVSFAKSQLKISGIGTIRSATIPYDSSRRLIGDIQALNASS
jgi:hypothetical protein